MKHREFDIILSKKHAPSLTLMCIMVLCFQQMIAQQLIWQRIYDNGEQDEALSVATDSKDNIIIVGTTIPGVGDPNDYGDILTIKYSPDGDTVWTRIFDSASEGGSADFAGKVTIDSHDNIIIAGTIQKEIDSTGIDILIIKYDSNGNILWTRTYGERDQGEFGYGVAIDSMDNILITGRVTINWGDYITLKYDSSGTLLWERTYDGIWEDVAKDVTVDDSDNVVVTGYSNGDMDWDWCTIKYNADGDLIWVRRYDISLDDWAYGVTTDMENNIIVVGNVRNQTRSCGMVVEYSSSGDILWSQPFADTLGHYYIIGFTDVATDVQNNIYVTGVDMWWDHGHNWRDYYIAKLNPQGDTAWTFRYDYDPTDEANAIALDKNGTIIVTGTTSQIPPVITQNYLTIKIEDINNSVDKDPYCPSNFFVYQNHPNPFNPSTQITYSLPRAADVTLKIYDILGQEVATLVNERKPAGTYTVNLNAVDIPTGIYFYRIVAGEFVQTKKMALIR